MADIRKLAAEIDSFMYDLDPHEYSDNVEDRDAHIHEIEAMLITDASPITERFKEALLEDNTEEHKQKVKELLKKISLAV